MQSKGIALGDLLLDPNNYRIQEQDTYTAIAADRYHLDRVQNGTLAKLKSENLKPLRDSIFANGFLEIERIVVSPYEHEEGKYLVIEGNRRIAALMQLKDEYESGIDIPEALVSVLDSVPCLIAENDGKSPFFREALMGIRHVGGIKQWGGFQRAKLIADLRDDHTLDPQTVAQRLGLSVQEVNRRYRAYKALQQMQEDDIYAEFASASKYPLFHEAVSLPIIRKWLEWDQNTNQFTNESQLEIFYQLITPLNAGQDDEKPPKISTFSHVRQLREIIPNQEAFNELLQLDNDLSRALAYVAQGEQTRRWRSEVSEAKSALSRIPATEAEDLTNDDLVLLSDLRSAIDKLVEIHRKLNA